MSIKNRVFLNLEQLSDRITPSTAVLSNGILFIQGDNQGNNINVLADANGNIHVTDRGHEIAISGPAKATTANVSLVEEKAGTGNNNTLATDVSLGAIPDTLLGNGTGVMTFKPGNNAPSTATGSADAATVNYFISNPGGKDLFTGGKGYNLFYWAPGTGTDTYTGAGKLNQVLVIGNTTGTAENDALKADGHGGVTYNRNNPVPFSLYTTGIQDWYIQPSTGAGNVVTVGDLTGTATQRVEIDASQSKVHAGNQANPNVHLVANGAGNSVIEGVGPTTLENVPAPTAASLLSALEALAQKHG